MRNKSLAIIGLGLLSLALLPMFAPTQSYQDVGNLAITCSKTIDQLTGIQYNAITVSASSTAGGGIYDTLTIFIDSFTGVTLLNLDHYNSSPYPKTVSYAETDATPTSSGGSVVLAVIVFDKLGNTHLGNAVTCA